MKDLRDLRDLTILDVHPIGDEYAHARPLEGYSMRVLGAVYQLEGGKELLLP